MSTLKKSRKNRDRDKLKHAKDKDKDHHKEHKEKEHKEKEHKEKDHKEKDHKEKDHKEKDHKEKEHKEKEHKEKDHKEEEKGKEADSKPRQEKENKDKESDDKGKEVAVQNGKGKEENRRVGPSDFKIFKMLGRGDVGRVFLARKKGTKDYYAVKILEKGEMIQRKKIKRVMTEREILATADHPFIVTLHWSFQSESKLYFVMDYCAGGAFFRMLQRQPDKRLKESSAKFYASEVLSALEYLHMMGFIYRDLKPENILLHHSGHIMLTDFDLSKASAMPVTPKMVKQMVNAKPSLVTNSFVGTEEYIAPEIITGFGHTSTVDWWTFGILMFEMIYGRTPFRGRNQDETFDNVLHREVRFPDNVEITKDCRDFIRRLLRIDPKKRLGSAHGAPDLKNHPFLKNVNWALIRNQPAPLIPKLTGPTDTKYFRKYSPHDSDLPEGITDLSSDEEFELMKKRSRRRKKVIPSASSSSSSSAAPPAAAEDEEEVDDGADVPSFSRSHSRYEEEGVNETSLPEKDPFRKFKSIDKSEKSKTKLL